MLSTQTYKLLCTRHRRDHTPSIWCALLRLSKLVVSVCLPATGLSAGTGWSCFHSRPDPQGSVAAELRPLPLNVLYQHFIGAQCHVPLPEATVDFGPELRKAVKQGNDV